MTKLNNSKQAERINPCHQEHLKSFACLDKNGYDRTKCEEYFENYNTCKKFWGQVYRDRKAKGIVPYLPELEDREKIKTEYFKNVKDYIDSQK